MGYVHQLTHFTSELLDVRDKHLRPPTMCNLVSHTV